MHFPRITTQQSRTPPPPPDRPTDRSFDRSCAQPSVVRVASRRPRATRRTRARDGRRCTHKIHRVSALASRPSHRRAREERVFVARSPRSRISVAYRSRVPPRSSRRRRRLASRRPTPSTASSNPSERTNAIAIASSPRTSRRERRARRGRRARESLRSESHHRQTSSCAGRGIAVLAIDRSGWNTLINTLIHGDRVRGMRVMARDRTRGYIVFDPTYIKW